MFNLIVKDTAWANGRDTITEGRIFESTEQALINRFRPGGQLDFVRLKELPIQALRTAQITRHRQRFSRLLDARL